MERREFLSSLALGAFVCLDPLKIAKAQMDDISIGQDDTMKFVSLFPKSTTLTEDWEMALKRSGLPFNIHYASNREEYILLIKRGYLGIGTPLAFHRSEEKIGSFDNFPLGEEFGAFAASANSSERQKARQEFYSQFEMVSHYTGQYGLFQGLWTNEHELAKASLTLPHYFANKVLAERGLKTVSCSIEEMDNRYKEQNSCLSFLTFKKDIFERNEEKFKHFYFFSSPRGPLMTTEMQFLESTYSRLSKEQTDKLFTLVDQIRHLRDSDRFGTELDYLEGMKKNYPHMTSAMPQDWEMKILG